MKIEDKLFLIEMIYSPQVNNWRCLVKKKKKKKEINKKKMRNQTIVMIILIIIIFNSIVLFGYYNEKDKHQKGLKKEKIKSIFSFI